MKEDIANLRGEMKEDIARLEGKIDTTAERLEGKIDATDITTLRSELKADIKVLHWMFSVLVAGNVALVLKAFF